jgi:tRNA(Ile2) C34 agmatinyltransferase TiaS
MCFLKHSDHTIVLVTEHDIRDQYFFYLRNLSKATMIVDGWTEDYYFPNLSAFERDRFNAGKTPNPVQLFIRSRVHRHLLAVEDFILYPEWCLST